MRNAVLTLLLALVLAPSVALGQIATDGRTQVGLSAFGFIGEFNIVTAVLSGTKFLDTNTEVGAGVTAIVGDFSSGIVTGLYRYNFVGESLTIPFLSAAAGIAFTDDNTSVSVNLGGGVKHFLSEDVSVNGEAQTLIADVGDGFGLQNLVILLVGVSVYFN